MRVSARHARGMNPQMSRTPNTDRRPTRVAPSPMLFRVVIGHFAVISLLANPIWLRCMESDGSVAIESAWSPCYATNESDDPRAPIPSSHMPGISDSQDADQCLDVALDCPAEYRRRSQAQSVASMAWTGGILGKKTVGTPLSEIAAPVVTVGHSGSVLTALRTVRLLT